MDIATTEGRLELGRRIQRAIMEAGYDSLPAFASQHGWSRALVYQYVNGTVLAQMDRLQLIAQATSRPLEWFVADDPDEMAGREQRREAQMAEVRDRLSAMEADLAAARQRILELQRDVGLSAVRSSRDHCRALRRGYDAAALLESAQRWAAAAEGVGDERGRLAALVQAGHAWVDLGQPAEAREVLEQARDLARASGDASMTRAARQELVRALQALGQMDEALACAKDLSADEDWWTRWAGLLTWAGLLEQTGDYAGAEGKLAEASEALGAPDAREEHLLLARAYIQGNRVNVLLGRGQYREAEEDAEGARRLSEQAGIRDQMLEALLNLSLAWLRGGKPSLARDALARAYEWAVLTADVRRQAVALCLQAELAARTGRSEDAKNLAHDALDLATTHQQPMIAAWACLETAIGHLAAGQPADAEYWLRQAEDRSHRAAARRLEMETRLWRLKADVRGRGAVPRGFGEGVAQFAEDARAMAMLDLAAEATAWQAYALAAAPGTATDAAALARSAAEEAAGLGAWWVEAVARGALALALAGQEHDEASSTADAFYLALQDRARELGLRANLVKNWLDAAPLQEAHNKLSRKPR